MSTPILATKLYAPKLRDKIVTRSHLISRMSEGVDYKLILLSASAGFGKTTLVTEWIFSCGCPVAWLSLDERDNDLIQFISYFAAGLHSVDKNLGNCINESLSTLQTVGLETVLTGLINKVAALPINFVYVMDDYHLIVNREVNAMMEFLLNQMPSNMRFIIITREEPKLPLAKLRARNQLLEFRAVDLKFSHFEVVQFFNRVMKLNIADHDLKTLEKRTEGWIAGIQLAALSMQGHGDISDFIEHFSGSHIYIMDYMVEEVLKQQSEDIQIFLLKTSILDRFCGDLCDTMLQKDLGSSQKILEHLLAANLFTIPLDNERKWFRYHHLFVDFLRQKFRKADSAGQEMAYILKRAGKWFEECGLISEAIQHTLVAKDYDSAATMIELEWAKMDKSLQNAVWIEWVKQLPTEMIRIRPVLSTGYAWALLDAGQLDGCEPRLQDAEKGIKILNQEEQEGIPPSIIIADKALYDILPATIANARAYKASAQGDIKGSIQYAKQALELLAEENVDTREVVTTLLGLSFWADGNLEAAYKTISKGIMNTQMEIMVTVVIAEIRIEQNKLHSAEVVLQNSIRAAYHEDEIYQIPVASFYLGLSKIKYMQGDISDAERLLNKSLELGEVSSLPNWRYHWLLLKAQMMVSQGEYEQGLKCLMEAEGYYHRNPIPDLQSIAAMKVRIYLKQGKISQAMDWAQESGVAKEEEPGYLDLYEYITLIRVYLAEFYQLHNVEAYDHAIHYLDQLLEKAKLCEWNRNVIEILILQAIAFDSTGKCKQAFESLRQAIVLSECEEYVQIFTEEGDTIHKLLLKAAVSTTKPIYSSKLLHIFETNKNQSSKTSAIGTAEIVESLSERELEVLRLIAEGLSNHEISDKLYLALSTVKGYNQNLFGKLQVKNRTEAMKRAQELGLL